MLQKDRNGVWHFVKEENSLFVVNWGWRWNFGAKIYIGGNRLQLFEGILQKLKEYSPIFTHEENWFIEDLEKEYLKRSDDHDECYTEQQVKDIIERVKDELRTH